MFFLSEELYFPPVYEANADGILAVGGDLSPERLILAYRSGIFPWFADDEPLLWWSPNPRMIIVPHEFKASKSMRNLINRNVFTVTYNQNFSEVIANCQKIKRKSQSGTWITQDMIDAYCKLNELGFAKSVEVWQNNQLVCGLYGVDLGNFFCGESMFSLVSNASKIAFVFLINDLKAKNYKLLDCQVHNPHLETLGCKTIPRTAFMELIENKTL